MPEESGQRPDDRHRHGCTGTQPGGHRDGRGDHQGAGGRLFDPELFQRQPDHQGDGVIQREVFQPAADLDIRGDQVDPLSAGAGVDDRPRLDLEHRHGDRRLSVDHGMFTEQDDLARSGSGKGWHDLVQVKDQ